MSVCVRINNNGRVLSTEDAPIDCIDFLLLTPTELQDISAVSVAEMINTLNELFRFDLTVFGIVHGSLLLAFMISHGAGRVVKLLGKA